MTPSKKSALKANAGCFGVLAIVLALLGWSIRNSYTWDDSIRAKVPKTWVLHHENRVGNLIKPWEWFSQPVVGLHYLIDSRQLEESQYAVTIVIFNHTDPVFDDERTHEFYGSPAVFSYLIDFEKGEESFLGEFAITGKTTGDLRRLRAKGTAEKIPRWRLDELRKSIDKFAAQK